MSSVVLVNAREGAEIRVAVLKNGVLSDLFYERVSSYGPRVGDIYKAKITSVDRSLDALFLDIGSNRDAFLPRAHIRELTKSSASLTSVYKTGRTILVQVVREETAHKGGLLTTYITIPGRYLVLCPFETGIRVSRKITDEKLRERLLKVVKTIVPEGFGFVIRTAAAEAKKADLARDFQLVVRLYKSIQEKAKRVPAPSLLYSESDLAVRVVRDLLTFGDTKIIVDEPTAYERMKRFLTEISPRIATRVQLYTEMKPLFDDHNIEDVVDSLMARRVDLPSGGWITIDITEGTVSIDVNTGSAKAETNEQVALQTNLEAVAEIARQLRLRDIGGLIVIDLVDMKQPSSRKKVEAKLRKLLREQKERFTMLPINRLGVLVLSRQKRREGGLVPWAEKCRRCGGLGHTISTLTYAAAALRQLQRYLADSPTKPVRLSLNPSVAEALFNDLRKALISIEEKAKCRVLITLDPSLAPGEVQILPT